VVDGRRGRATSTCRSATCCAPATRRWPGGDGDLGLGRGVDVLPSSRNLIDREADSRDADAALRLRTALDPMLDRYRFVFIDCAPSLGPTTRSGLAVADRVLLVVELSALSIRGAEAVLETVEDVWSDLNPDLDVGGVIVNRAPAVSLEAVRQEDELNRLMGKRAVWRPFVPQRTVLNEAVGDRSPIHAWATGARDVRGVRRALPQAPPGHGRAERARPDVAWAAGPSSATHPPRCESEHRE
jgi:chromosome partitioning protein